MEIFETTLRDGEQEAFLHFSPQQKAELATLLEKLGVDVIDAGFPAASQVDLESIKLIAANTNNVRLSILARPIKKDVYLAYEAVKGAEKRSRIATSVKPYDLLSKHNYASACEKTIKNSIDLITEIRSLFPEAQYYLVCAGSREKTFLAELSEAVGKAGATHLTIADTLSTMEPKSFGSLVGYVRKYLPENVVLGVHCHNLIGLGLYNSIAGIENGAEQVEVTIGNTGDAGGNTALEQLLAYAKFFQKNNPRFVCNCRLEVIDELVQKIKEYTGIRFSPNQPLIGKHSFLVETGIHQSIPSKLLKKTFAPEIVGRSTKTVIGRHSGISGIKNKLQEINVSTDGINLNILYKKVMNVAEKKGLVSDETLKEIVNSLR